ncbi:uncharacterized protein JCM6883_004402 [Sporobolomyces salmoneus]|uniref:uncharacterized protein n=1 Tax=Sporobolomyces salmoneus TaxID=183962 RepID=UPI00316C75DF
MSDPATLQGGIPRGPSLDQVASRPQQPHDFDKSPVPETHTHYHPSPSSELSALPSSSSAMPTQSSSPVKQATEVNATAASTLINSSDPTRSQPLETAQVEKQSVQDEPKESKKAPTPPVVAPPTPAASASPPHSTSIPLPSFLSEDPLSDDPDSSSDEDALGYPKPPRPPRYSKSTGLPRPRPNYYYDAEYDPGTAGTKKRGRRGGFKGVPVFEPTMEDFEQNGGFYGYVKRIEKYGLRSGIVKVIPPKEWSASLPTVLPPLKDIRLQEPIEQHMMGSQGLYRVTNVASSKIWNPAQWKESAEKSNYDAPDLLGEQKKGDRSERSTKSTSALTESRKKKLASKKKKEADGEFDGGDEEDDEEGSPKKGRRTPAKKLGRPPKVAATEGDGQPKKRLTKAQKAEPTEEEWEAFSAKFEELPHGMKKEDYSVEMMRDFERRYWRTLTFGESPMYGADMAGSLFNDSTAAWNVAHLGDLLPKLAPRDCSIPGVVSPYLYFGMWRATFAWHVEDADLYSINYIHFGAPKFWYSVPQEQSEKFERVMEGFFPTDRARCSQFLRHKAFLASPRVLSNNGITLNRCAQLPGEFILTYPKGYHSGFNLGYNCAESINFATERWLPLGKVAKSCRCIEDSVSIDVNIWLKEAAKAEALDRGESWPYDPPEEPEPVAITVSAPVQRKRMAATGDAPPRKRAKPAATPRQFDSMYETGGTANLTPPQKAQLAQYIQQQMAFAGLTTLSLAQQTTLEQQYLRLLADHIQQQRVYQLQVQQQAPASKAKATPPPPPPKPDFVCALCPDLNTEGLVDIGENGVKSKKKAHRLCVMFTPATWIEVDEATGQEMVRGLKGVEKARWKLKCTLCTEPYGVKVQCTMGKCSKSFHVSCALAEGSGIFLDATLPEVGGGQISVLATTKALDAPPSPSKAASTSNEVPEEEKMPEIEPDGQLKLTILCRTHNPNWKLQEQARKANELKAKLDALQYGNLIRVKIGNGSIYDVYFVSSNPEQESVKVAHGDGATAFVKWKNIIWPESDEVRRKKEEATRKIEEQKAAALDRAAYRENVKKRAPQVPSAAPMIQARSTSSSYYSPTPAPGYPVPPPHYYPQQAVYPGYPYPSPTTPHYQPQMPYGYPVAHPLPPYGYVGTAPRAAYPPSNGLSQPIPFHHQSSQPQHYVQPSPTAPVATPQHAQGVHSSHSFSHLLNSEPNSQPQSPQAFPSAPPPSTVQPQPTQ